MSSDHNDIANYRNEKDTRDDIANYGNEKDTRNTVGRDSDFCPKDEPVSQETYKCMPGRKNDEREGTSLKQVLFSAGDVVNRTTGVEPL